MISEVAASAPTAMPSPAPSSVPESDIAAATGDADRGDDQGDRERAEAHAALGSLVVRNGDTLDTYPSRDPGRPPDPPLLESRRRCR